MRKQYSFKIFAEGENCVNFQIQLFEKKNCNKLTIFEIDKTRIN